jgi:hypothetical protein
MNPLMPEFEEGFVRINARHDTGIPPKKMFAFVPIPQFPLMRDTWFGWRFDSRPGFYGENSICILVGKRNRKSGLEGA